MQIALIAGTYHPECCGVADYTAHLRQALAERDVKSVVLTTQAAAQDTTDPMVQGIVEQWDLSSLLPLIRAIWNTRADLLHIQHAAGTYRFERAIFLLPLLLRATGWQQPIVTTVHEYGWWEWQPQWIPSGLLESLKTWGQKRGWWDREDGFLLTQSSVIVTTNQGAKTTIQARLPDLEPPYLIPIGANISVSAAASQPLEQARAQMRLNCGWTVETEVIAFFGFLHPVKGLETLLPAFKQALNHRPQARLLLIGGVESLALPKQQGAEYWQKLHQFIHQLGLADRVHLTGYLEDDAVSQYLRVADLGVLPFNHGVTLKSGSLLALLAHQLPVIATRSTPPDPDLEAGLIRLVPPRQIEALAAALIELLADPELRQHLGQAGYKFSQRFSWSSIADAHLRIYEQVCQTATQHHPQKMAHR